MMKIRFIGLGNPILGDDGAGIYTLHMLEALLPTDSDIDCIELSVGGITLMEQMVGFDQVIIIDSLWTPVEQTGQVLVFTIDDMPETLNTRSTHDADLPTALRIGRELGARLPDNDHIRIVAITANQVLDFRDTPTQAVAAAIPRAAAMVLDLLKMPDTIREG